MSEEIALRLIERCSRYLEAPPHGLSYYEFWIASEEDATPGIGEVIRSVALRLLEAETLRLRRSAIQALACVGTPDDLPVLASLRGVSDALLSAEIDAAHRHLAYRMKSLEALLDEVNSKASFVLFARALAKEREVAQQIETADRKRYMADGALGWKNADISSFIYAGLSAFSGVDQSDPPSWSDLAYFLYQGKVVE